MLIQKIPGFSYTKSRLYPETALEPFFDLGPNQPPANSLRKEDEAHPGPAPLCLAWSSKSRCPELTFSVDPQFLFSHYLWVTGTSSTARNYAEIFAERILKRLPKHAPKNIIEIASNDGTFLKPFITAKYSVLGIDPAKNIVEQATACGVPSICEFFSKELVNNRADLKSSAGCIFARNVLPHVNDPRSIIEGMFNALDSNGIAAIEFHHSGKILEELHYDSIYHEHIFYFPVTSVYALAKESGLHPFDLEWSPISGGSAVLFLSKAPKEIEPALKNQLEKEENSGILTLEAWKNFARESQEHAKKLTNLVHEAKHKGNIIGYGASARSSTMLNFCGINHLDLTAIADQSEYKHSRFTAGSNIKILSPDEALKLKPQTILLLAWNFQDEIIQILKERYNYKGDIILPLPNQPKIINL